MYERLSARADRVIKSAHSIAKQFDQEYVGTEHVLLAIADETEGNGARVLQAHNVNGTQLRDEIQRLIQHSKEETWVFGRLPGTPHFRNVVATAIEQARQLDSKVVGSEHLLLALLIEKGSVAYSALKNLGLEHEKARQTLIDLLH